MRNLELVTTYHMFVEFRLVAHLGSSLHLLKGDSSLVRSGGYYCLCVYNDKYLGCS